MKFTSHNLSNDVRLTCAFAPSNLRLPVLWFCAYKFTLNIQGPVVQSVVSLTSLLRVISLTVLMDLVHSMLIFFAEKM